MATEGDQETHSTLAEKMEWTNAWESTASLKEKEIAQCNWHYNGEHNKIKNQKLKTTWNLEFQRLLLDFVWWRTILHLCLQLLGGNHKALGMSCLIGISLFAGELWPLDSLRKLFIIGALSHIVSAMPPKGLETKYISLISGSSGDKIQSCEKYVTEP